VPWTFLEKPFDDDALLAAVHSALASEGDSSKRTAEVTELNEKLKALSNRERQSWKAW
jgi:two-component system response regulator FixJ